MGWLWIVLAGTLLLSALERLLADNPTDAAVWFLMCLLVVRVHFWYRSMNICNGFWDGKHYIVESPKGLVKVVTGIRLSVIPHTMDCALRLEFVGDDGNTHTVGFKTPAILPRGVVRRMDYYSQIACRYPFKDEQPGAGGETVPLARVR